MNNLKYTLKESLLVFTIISFLLLLHTNTYAQGYKKIKTEAKDNIQWDFNSLQGWKYDHQDDNPEHQCNIENGILRIYTKAQSLDRKKVATIDNKYTTGRYTWKTYISQMGEGDQASIGCFIYCDDHHEIDFEIGYGKAEIRDSLNAQPDEMIAYMTTQDFPFQSVPVKIKTGWHLWEFDISIVNNSYKVDWIIDNIASCTVNLMYGDEFTFRIYCSVENLKFIGDHMATQDNYALFDFVSYKFHE